MTEPQAPLDLHRGFADADGVDSAAPMHAFLDAVERIPEFQWYRGRIRNFLAPEPGDRVIDVGCGSGYHACRIAGEFPEAQVIGLDRPAMLVEARRRASTTDVTVDWLPAEAQALPLPEGTVDGCLMERVLKYLPDPEVAVAEVARVLRPGGRLGAFELDYASTMLGGAPDIADQVAEVLGSSVAQQRMGRQLPELLRDAGLVDVAFQPIAFHTPWNVHEVIVRDAVRGAVRDGRLPATAAQGWLDELADAAHTSKVTSTFVGMLVTATAPSTS